MLPEVGEEGQKRLSNARILLVGAGGLGSPSALYLAAAGVGTIAIADDDTVELSNLQRQVLHSTKDIGRLKVDSAKDHISQLNPLVEVITIASRVSTSNVSSLLSSYDLILDGSDNIATRYLLSDACVRLSKPLLFASISQFEGQASMLIDNSAPCYRCLYPVAPPLEFTLNCSQAGVLGVLPAILGCLQATEAIKWILKIGEPLCGKLWTWNALTSTSKIYKVERELNCAGCSPEALKNQQLQLNNNNKEGDPQTMKHLEISPVELKNILDSNEAVQLVDVRSTEEHKISNIGGKLIPLDTLDKRYVELDKNVPVIVFCHHGIRSRSAAKILLEHGFTQVHSLSGGIDRWSRQIDPSIPRY